MLRPEEVEEALDRALSRLLQGESVQVVLATQELEPELAAELAPLLELAEQLRRLAATRPAATAALAAGRERFLRHAATLRTKEA